MSKTQQPATEVVKGTPGFQVGHPRQGGRKKRTAQMARDLADSMGCDPLAFLMGLIQRDTYMQTEIGPDGKKKRVEVAVTMDLRLDAAKTVVNYLYPRLNAQTISGPGDGPIAVAELDMARLCQDPAMVEKMQELAIAMAIADTPPAPAPARILPPADEYREHR
jgi:hypothetical protein